MGGQRREHLEDEGVFKPPLDLEGLCSYLLLVPIVTGKLRGN